MCIYIYIYIYIYIHIHKHITRASYGLLAPLAGVGGRDERVQAQQDLRNNNNKSSSS